MRAIYFDQFDFLTLQEGFALEVSGDEAHHLIKVVRIKQGEEILLMNGQGGILNAEVLDVQKKSLHVKILKKSFCTRKNLIDLAICPPKKDAYEDVLRQSTEIGIANIFPLMSEYSDRFILSSERANKILQGALIQSNNPFLPKIHGPVPFEKLSEIMSGYEQCVYFSSNEITQGPKSFSPAKKILLLVGPEGGLSEKEENFLKNLSKVTFLHLSTPILKTPTAVAVAAGFILGKS